MINILTDSTADIPEELRSKYQIDTIPMYIQINGRVYKDKEDIDAQMLFDQVSKTGKYPTTSAPSPADFAKFFDQKEPSIYIGVSSNLSSAFKNAQLARREMNGSKVEIIDSLSFSTGYGQVVLQAAEWRNEGMDILTLIQKIKDFTKKARGIFILDTLDYLYNGGRCSSIEHFFSSLLKIRPFLNVRPDGTLGVLQKIRGTRIRSVKALINYLVTHKDEIADDRVYVTHLDCDEEAQFISDNLKLHFPKMEIIPAIVGCALASHSGPYPIGIAYHVQ